MRMRILLVSPLLALGVLLTFAGAVVFVMVKLIFSLITILKRKRRKYWRRYRGRPS